MTDEEELEEGAAVGETVEEVVGDVVGEVEESPHPALPEKLDRQTLDSIIEKYGIAEGMAMADGLKVTALRTLAREYGELKISGREVSKANKQLLLEELKSYYEARND